MLPQKAPLPVSHRDSSPEDRRHGRFRCDGAYCSIGRILDLSVSGMRVRRRRPSKANVGDEATVTMPVAGGKLQITAKVVWVKRVGFFSYDYGLSFVDLTPEARTALYSISRSTVDFKPEWMQHTHPAECRSTDDFRASKGSEGRKAG